MVDTDDVSRGLDTFNIKGIQTLSKTHKFWLRYFDIGLDISAILKGP